MSLKSITNVVFPLLTIAIIIGVSLLVIAYGRGYRLDLNNKSLGTTGMITATSDPTGAQLYIDGKLKGATNMNINVVPGWYNVAVVKNGYQTWEKKIRVQGEVLTRIDAMLFSSNPSLFALTTSGAVNPTLSPDGTKLAYVVPESPEASTSAIVVSRAGIWILDLIDKPLGLNRDARQIIKQEQLNVTDARFQWSPDSKQLLVITSTNDPYLLDSDRLNETTNYVNDVPSLMNDWTQLKATKDKEKLLSLKTDVMNLASSSMNIIAFSPDETKILYEASESATLPQIIDPPLIGTNPTEEVRTIKIGNIYVYDIKEDRNYLIEETKTQVGKGTKPTITPNQTTQSLSLAVTQSSSPIQWLPTSRHLLVIGQDKIEVMDFDGGNRKVVYAGPFWDGFVAPWSNAGRIVILTNLNSAASLINNLYAVNIR